MRLVVNDANILIDIIKLNILPQFFSLGLKFHTTSFVLLELHEHQQRQLDLFIEQRILIVEEFDVNEIQALGLLQEEKAQLSQQDCSALFCAQKLNATLLTSDHVLRQFAQSKAVEVHGHLWILDLLVKENTLTGNQAVSVLDNLKQNINPRLGLSERLCRPLIEKWLDL